MEKDIDLTSNRTIQKRLTGAFTITTFVISALYGLLVFNAMKYTEDDILNRRLILESMFYFEQYAKDSVTAKLPQSRGLHSYLSSSADLPQWLREQPLGTRELHDREVHVGVLQIPDSEELLYLSLSEHDSSSLESELSTLLVILILVGVFISTIGLIIGLIFSRTISKPIRQLTDDVENKHRDSSQPFYGAELKDEVGALSRAFYRLVTRLQDFLIREKQFTRYASHEFRTPISLIKNALANLRLPVQNSQRTQRNLARIDAAANELENLLNTFLNLGREASQNNVEEINVIDVLNSNIERNKLVNRNKNLMVEVTVKTPPKILKNDKSLVDILFDNIIRNMYTHGTSAAQITVEYNVIRFENNTHETNTLPHEEQIQSFGMEIVNELAFKLGFTIVNSTETNAYIIALHI